MLVSKVFVTLSYLPDFEYSKALSFFLINIVNKKEYMLLSKDCHCLANL